MLHTDFFTVFWCSHFFEHREGYLYAVCFWGGFCSHLALSSRSPTTAMAAVGDVIKIQSSKPWDSTWQHQWQRMETDGRLQMLKLAILFTWQPIKMWLIWFWSFFPNLPNNIDDIFHLISVPLDPDRQQGNVIPINEPHLWHDSIPLAMFQPPSPHVVHYACPRDGPLFCTHNSHGQAKASEYFWCSSRFLRDPPGWTVWFNSSHSVTQRGKMFPCWMTCWNTWNLLRLLISMLKCWCLKIFLWFRWFQEFACDSSSICVSKWYSIEDWSWLSCSDCSDIGLGAEAFQDAFKFCSWKQ